MYKDYFNNYKKGEAYSYGLKCASPEFSEDSREIVYVAKNETRDIKIIHDSYSRKFLQVHVAHGAVVNVEVVLIAQENSVVDSYIEIIHEGDEGVSTLSVRGFTEDNGCIISRVRTHVSHDVSRVQAKQTVSLYQFGKGGVIDCIPMLEVENKTTVSSHAVRLEKISDVEYWNAAQRGIGSGMYQNLKKKSLYA